jgi:hypothetical protein
MAVYLHQNSTTTGNGNIIDILGAYQESVPPVLTVVLTGSGAYTIQGSHDMTSWITYFSGTSSDSRDLIVGIRYWRVVISSISGSLTAAVGPVPNINGDNITPAIYTPSTVSGG